MRKTFTLTAVAALLVAGSAFAQPVVTSASSNDSYAVATLSAAPAAAPIPVGGCMLVRREALAAAGGIAAIRTALIDDCALGAALKRQGPIWLGLTERSRSIRPYETLGSVAAMISRSAYAQLNYNPLLLLGTLLGLALVYGAPPALTLLASGW
eukprot:gene2829-3863_t